MIKEDFLSKIEALDKEITESDSSVRSLIRHNLNAIDRIVYDDTVGLDLLFKDSPHFKKPNETVLIIGNRRSIQLNIKGLRILIFTYTPISEPRKYDGLGEVLVPQRYTVHVGENEAIIEEWSVCTSIKELLHKPEFEPYFIKQYRKTKVASLIRHGDLHNSNYELAND